MVHDEIQSRAASSERPSALYVRQCAVKNRGGNCARRRRGRYAKDDDDVNSDTQTVRPKRHLLSCDESEDGILEGTRVEDIASVISIGSEN